ncbi:MAG: ferredoxin family protein [Ruminococcus sp.]
MLTVDYEKCTGCGACVQCCPKRCISWTQREFGFRYPQIDKDACVNCGLCEKVCPIDKALEVSDEQKAYAAVHKDDEVLAKSTSGGRLLPSPMPSLRKAALCMVQRCGWYAG